MNEMQSTFRPVLGFLLLLYGVSLIDSVKGEVCFQDVNCTMGEFCNISAQPYKRRPPFGKQVAGICVKCLDCSAFNREVKRSKNQQCAKNITDCGICLEPYQPMFSHSGIHMDCKPKYLANGSALNSSRLAASSEDEVDDGSLQSTGTILGGVAIGLVAVAIIAFFGFFGVKHYKGRKQKKNKKVEDPENATTTELQELKPVPLPEINELAKDQTQSEER